MTKGEMIALLDRVKDQIEKEQWINVIYALGGLQKAARARLDDLLKGRRERP